MTTQQALRRANSRYQRRRSHAIAHGTWRPFVDAQPVRKHVEAIRATGMSVADLAAASGVNRGALAHLLYGTGAIPPARKLRPETAQALLNYWPVLDDYSDSARINSTGTLRRVRALASVGWTWTAMANHIDGWCRSTFERLSHDKPVTAALARAIRDMYDQVAAFPAEEFGVARPAAQRARTCARRASWPDPLWWEDWGGIDDPMAPESEPAASRNSQAEARYRAAEIRHLAAGGVRHEEIAARLSTPAQTITTEKVREVLRGRRQQQGAA